MEMSFTVTQLGLLLQAHPEPAGFLRKKDVAAHLEETVDREGILAGQDKTMSQPKLYRDSFTCTMKHALKGHAKHVFMACLPFWLVYMNFRACALSP